MTSSSAKSLNFGKQTGTNNASNSKTDNSNGDEATGIMVEEIVVESNPTREPTIVRENPKPESIVEGEV